MPEVITVYRNPFGSAQEFEIQRIWFDGASELRIEGTLYTIVLSAEAIDHLAHVLDSLRRKHEGGVRDGRPGLR